MPETIYAETLITLPEFHYVGLESINKYLSFSITENYTPHYIIDGQYWSGSAWVASDNSYSQSNNISTFNTNLPTKTANDNPVIKIIFQSSNNQSNVTNLILTYGLLLNMVAESNTLALADSILSRKTALTGASLSVSSGVGSLAIVFLYTYIQGIIKDPLTLKVGNTQLFKFTIKNQGLPITHLSDAANIVFMIKENQDDLDIEAILTKTLHSGIEINRNDIIVTIDSADTQLANVGQKYLALQINFSTTDKVEINIIQNGLETQFINIISDIIRG